MVRLNVPWRAARWLGYVSGALAGLALAPTVLAAAAAPAAATTHPSARASAQCQQVALAPQSDELAAEIRVSASCSIARDIASLSGPFPVSIPGTRVSYHARGFGCQGVDRAGSPRAPMEYVAFRCSRGRSTIYFNRYGALVEYRSRAVPSDCSVFHAGSISGDGEYTDGAMLTATGVSCQEALGIVAVHYEAATTVSGSNGFYRLFRMGSFTCQRLPSEGPVTVKVCSDGLRGFRFM